MARIKRIVLPGWAHHVEQRAAGLCAGDGLRGLHLRHLIDAARRFRTRVLGWCALDDCVRLVAVPPDRRALGLLMRAATTVYVREANWLRSRRRRVLGERFRSCVLSPEYLPVAVRSMELAAVRARLAARPEDWPWSSARYHLGRCAVDLLVRRRDVPLTVADWRQWLSLSDAAAEKHLERCTRTGWPCGGKGFAEQVGRRLRRRLEKRRPGPEPREMIVWGGRRWGWCVRKRKAKAGR